MTNANAQAVYQPGSDKIHLGRRAGTYPSGAAKWVKACGTNRNDRYFPSPCEGGAAAITCKRCQAKLAPVTGIGTEPYVCEDPRAKCE